MQRHYEPHRVCFCCSGRTKHRAYWLRWWVTGSVKPYCGQCKRSLAHDPAYILDRVEYQH